MPRKKNSPGTCCWKNEKSSAPVISSDSLHLAGRDALERRQHPRRERGSFEVTGSPGGSSLDRGAGADGDAFGDLLDARVDVVLHLLVERADRADQPRGRRE